MKSRTYSTPAAFRTALEARLRQSGRADADFPRHRQLVVFERFLARIVVVFGPTAVLKGGLALELRLERARTTRDIDLRVTGSTDDILSRLQDAARRDLGDFMTFEVGADADHPEIQGEGMIYAGRRFRAECKLSGKVYGQPFGVDVGFGDPIHGEPDLHVAEDVLGFAGIAPPALRLYPVETHIAEKLHAYTLPRRRPNSRVKDLPDLALLSLTRDLRARDVRAALEQTFGFRATHAIPSSLPAPPPTWRAPYTALAREDELPWTTLDQVAGAAARFLDPVLGVGRGGRWDAHEQMWRTK